MSLSLAIYFWDIIIFLFCILRSSLNVTGHLIRTFLFMLECFENMKMATMIRHAFIGTLRK